jgi:hypothetical protein
MLSIAYHCAIAQLSVEGLSSMAMKGSLIRMTQKQGPDVLN